MEAYPEVHSEEPERLAEVLREVVRLREDDVSETDNLVQRFVKGRRVGKIPSSSTDVATNDRQNDVSVAADGTFLYMLVDSTAGLQWRRSALSTF